MKMTLNHIYLKIEELEKILIGNGKIGLCETVRAQDVRIKSLESKPFKMKEWALFGFVFLSTLVTILNYVLKG